MQNFQYLIDLTNKITKRDMVYNKNTINEILDKYEQEWLNWGEVDYFSLEHELRDVLNIGYQEASQFPIFSIVTST